MSHRTEAVSRVARPAWPSPARSRVLLLLPVVLLVAMGWVRRWTFEDAFLNYRVVDQIRAGHGPVFNIGQRVEAATSVLWLWILVALRTVLPFVHIEYLAIYAGLVGAGLGVWWVERGAVRLWTSGEPSASTLVPLGAVVIVALSATWDWSTSGLENGLSFAWLGATMLALASVATGDREQGKVRIALVGALVGIGWLVRPDLAVISVTVLAALVWLLRGRRREVVLLLGGALALPVAYEIFRMGYYGTVVPNTALAKDAQGVYWHQGVNYLLDFLGTYWLAVPLVGLAVAAAVLTTPRRSPPLVAVLALPVGGLLHALYITRAGGDYVHARLLLPSLFAIVAPFAAVPWRRKLTLPVAAIGIWAIVAIFGLRTGTGTGILSKDGRGINDGRQLMRGLTKRGDPPILARDFTPTDGLLARRLQREGERALVMGSATGKPPILDATPARTTLISITSGISGYLAGPEVWVHEAQGLADPVGSRLTPKPISPPGHRKRQSFEWMLAITARPGVTAGYDADAIAAERAAIHCGALAQLVRATTAPLTAGRFWSDITHAVSRTTLVVPRDPHAAEAKFCGPPSRR